MVFVFKLWTSFGKMQVEEIQCLFLMDTLLTYIFLFLGILYSMYKDYIRPRFFSVYKK